ncbi:MAG: hypothetical protein P4N59_31690 [Negativicutes bacterium]|nr:hypothetical protein [Negativicutes bacterium]
MLAASAQRITSGWVKDMTQLAPGAWWYIGIAIVAYSTIGFVLLKTKNPKSFISFCCFAAVNVIFDIFILVVFNGYMYAPGIRVEPGADNSIGRFVSQNLSVPSTAMLIAALQLNYYYIVAFTGVYCAIEELFLRLGTYKHFWWKTWYTAIALLVFFWFAQKWHNKIMAGDNRIVNFVSHYLGVVGLIFQYKFYMTMFKMHTYKFGLSTDPILDSMAVGLIHTILLPLPLVIVCFLELHWLWKLAATIWPFLFQHILIVMGIMHVREGFYGVDTLLTNLGAFIIVASFDVLLSKNRPKFN